MLLHISSLPEQTGFGDFGGARRFIDFLASTGMRVWQVLPLGPTHRDLSPYLCTSSMAGNPLFIDLDWLREKGWLGGGVQTPASVDSLTYRMSCLQESFECFKNISDTRWRGDYSGFIVTHSDWLNDFALYTALWNLHGGIPWMSWPASLRDYNRQALQQANRDLADTIETIKFEQFIFYCQWLEIKAYANAKGVLLFGDMPLYVAHDSAEVWSNRGYFQVDEVGKAKRVAGVPPDYFSATGQKWGNPVYDWARMQADGFVWWVKRLQTQLELYNLLRIDHFRGLQAYWEIPADAHNAAHGQWRLGPGATLLETLQRALGCLPLVAEDLGFITREVLQLRDQFGLPGMKIIQFAFDGSTDNPYLLHRHIENCVVYTGTHDNDTTLAWYQKLPENVRAIVDREMQQYCLNQTPGKNPVAPMLWTLINYTLSSAAGLVILPMQDILGLGEGYRLNTPGTTSGNWRWQFSWQQVTPDLTARLNRMLIRHRRVRVEE